MGLPPLPKSVPDPCADVVRVVDMSVAGDGKDIGGNKTNGATPPCDLAAHKNAKRGIKEGGHGVVVN